MTPDSPPPAQGEITDADLDDLEAFCREPGVVSRTDVARLIAEVRRLREQVSEEDDEYAPPGDAPHSRNVTQVGDPLLALRADVARLRGWTEGATETLKLRLDGIEQRLDALTFSDGPSPDSPPPAQGDLDRLERVVSKATMGETSWGMLRVEVLALIAEVRRLRAENAQHRARRREREAYDKIRGGAR